MANSLILPIAVVAVGVIVTLFFGKRPVRGTTGPVQLPLAATE